MILRKTKSLFRAALLIGLASAYIPPTLTFADKVCLKAAVGRNNKVKLTRNVVTSGNCQRGFLELVSTDSLTGPTGPAGAAGATGASGPIGANGQLRIYGDGSAGALNVTYTGELLTGWALNGNLQFTNLTVESGVTLYVPSGTVIRCNGTFTNHGTVQVGEVFNSGGGFAYSGGLDTGLRHIAFYPPLPGIAHDAAGFPELGDNSAGRMGGLGSTGLRSGEASAIVKVGMMGGGGGTGVYPSSLRPGYGGGTVTILAQSGIVNDGIITANGTGSQSLGGGGGGGGVIILASPGSIIQTGTIEAKGGDGYPAGISVSNGGGGGGGLVHLFSPSITSSGTITVTGGLGGTGTSSIATTIRAGGGGGGGCAGAGGNGGHANSDNSVTNAGNGFSGYSLQTQVDPTALF